MAEQAGFPEGESSEDFSIDEDDDDKEPTAEVIATHDDLTAKASLSPKMKKRSSSSSSQSDKKTVIKERLEWLRDHDKHEMEEARKALRKYESKMSLAELKLMVRLTKRVERELRAIDSAGIKLFQILMMARRKQRTHLKVRRWLALAILNQHGGMGRIPSSKNSVLRHGEHSQSCFQVGGALSFKYGRVTRKLQT